MFEDDEDDTATTLYRSSTERSTTTNRSDGGCGCGCNGPCVAQLSAADDDDGGLGGFEGSLTDEGAGVGEEVVVCCCEGQGAGWCVDTALSSLVTGLLRERDGASAGRKVAWTCTDRFSLLPPPSFSVYMGAFFLNSTTSLTCQTPHHITSQNGDK